MDLQRVRKLNGREKGGLKDCVVDYESPSLCLKSRGIRFILTADECFFGQDTHLSLGPGVQGHSEWSTRALGPECGSAPMAWVRPAEEGCGGRRRSHPRGRSEKTNICWASWWGDHQLPLQCVSS